MSRFVEVDDAVMCFMTTTLENPEDPESIAIRVLSSKQRAIYHGAKDDGLDEEGIFGRLFPDEVEEPSRVSYAGKFVNLDGTLYAVMNWRQRHRAGDTAVLRPLEADEIRELNRLKRRRLSETRIFETLFGEDENSIVEFVEEVVQKHAGARVEVELSILTKEQLVEIIQRMLGGVVLASMTRATREDLETMLLKLREKT